MKAKKQKEWFKIIAPKYFGEKEIGKSLAADPNSLIGKRLTLSAIELTDNFSKYYLKITFKVNQINGQNAFTDFDKSECMRDYISRMVLRRVRRIDTVQDLTTKDGRKIRVKGLVIIGRRIKSSIQTKVSNKVKDILKANVEGSTLEGFVKQMISDDIKNQILEEVRSTYPLRNFEIRKAEVIS